jgi:para-nitrobenzyl esterase
VFWLDFATLKFLYCVSSTQYKPILMKKPFLAAILPVLAGVAILFSAFKYRQNQGNNADTVSVDGGLVSGVKSANSDIVSYKGIPFAAPPVGDLRWKAPQPVIPWQGVKVCDTYSASPMQPDPKPFMVYTPEFLIAEKPISEDCLYLNVWTGAHKGEKRAVMLWIYGGGFGSGGTSVPIYDGEALAKKGIIFVSANYRVGVFGFLAHPELTKESPTHSSGNYGLMDQIAALNWIKNNIAAFGGDPDNVTIDGQSAGSMSVNSLVASPQARGLFKHAIAESGSFMVANPLIAATSLQTAEQQGLKFQEGAHAGSLADLRKMPAEDLLKVQAGRFSPITDGYVLPKPVYQIFADNGENHVPVITGWNADESFVMSFKKADAYKADIKKQYGADADEILKYYPGNSDEEAQRSQVRMSRDQTFAMSGFKWITLQSERGIAPVYAYNFNRRLPATADYVRYGAFHTGEVAYALDDLKFLNRPWEPADQPLADLMSDYWVNFVKTGSPNGKGLPEWPKYNNKTQQAMVFDATSGAKTLPDKDALKYMVGRAESGK